MVMLIDDADINTRTAQYGDLMTDEATVSIRILRKVAELELMLEAMQAKATRMQEEIDDLKAAADDTQQALDSHGIYS